MSSFTPEQLSILEAAIAEGTTRVRYADKTVEYRSLDEMLRIRNLMREELGAGGAGGRYYGEFNKGLYGRK